MKKIRQMKSTTLILTSLLILQGCSTPGPVEKQVDETTTIAVVEDKKDMVEQESSTKHQTVPAEPILPVAVQADMSLGALLHKRKTSMTAEAPAKIALNYKAEMFHDRPTPQPIQFNRESYNSANENPFVTTSNDPLSTFSIDVDTASYANVRRFLNNGTMPPPGAVRIEEMLNYFSYNYPEPQDSPIRISSEVGPCLWQPENKLVRIGLKAKSLSNKELPPSNLVFLIDVSGSMNHPNKLVLLKKSMNMLTEQLTAKDRVSIVAYAGSDRVVLPPTSGDKKEIIQNGIANLNSGGSTHASKGIQTAYQLARQTFMPGGNNRVILASDGDFNVGITSRDQLEQLIVKERESGVFLTVLGFGMGNYHDDTMEILADKGNGNYSYIDTLLEAKKVLIKERTSTFFTLARDVKLQIEFNPKLVGAYRLIGYENRTLADEDFNNDKKDAGEIGVGHTVTALYEIVSPGSNRLPAVDPLKYQSRSQYVDDSNELLTVKLRYKATETEKSTLLSSVVINNDNIIDTTSDDFRFVSSVAGFGMLLKKSDHRGKLTYQELIELARNSRGSDREGYRAELIKLIEMAEIMDK